MATIIRHRVAGTRVTVWDVLHHLENHWSIEAIADVLDLSTDQVQAAADYIREHHDEVMAVHRSIEDRNARGNPPQVAAKLAENRAKRVEWMKSRQQVSTEEPQGVGHRR